MAIIFPASLVAGDTLEFESFDDSGLNRSPVDYSLVWAIRGENILDNTAVAGSDVWTTTLTNSETNQLEAGNYSVFGSLVNTNSGNRYTVYQGSLVVLANPTNIYDGYDPRSEAQKTLDAVNASIKIRAEGGISNYSIEGRSATYYSLEELLKLRDRYTAIVAQEKQAEAVAQGLPNPKRLRVRFY